MIQKGKKTYYTIFEASSLAKNSTLKSTTTITTPHRSVTRPFTVL